MISAFAVIGIMGSIGAIVYCIGSWKSTNKRIQTKYNDPEYTNFCKVMRVLLFIGIPCVCIGLCCAIINNETSKSGLGSKFDNEHNYGKIACAYCGSLDTCGGTTYWYNDGTMCNGSKEYNKTHADYVIYTCKTCGHNFKVYLNN